MRGRDYLTVGFWNIEKHNVLPEDGQAVFENQMLRRTSFVMRSIERWFSRSQFDVLILAEVAQRRTGGEDFARTLATRLSRSFGLRRCNMQGAFHWFPGNGDRVSPCNYIAIWNDGLPELTGLANRVEFYWEPDWVRPMIILQGGTLVVGGLHAKSARRDLARQEILESCTYLYQNYRQRAVLIGDMNIPYDEFPPATERELQRWGWGRTPPGLPATYQSRGVRYGSSVLDYMWHNGGVTVSRADPPIKPYDGWDENDHAPIQYDAIWNMDGYDKADEMDWDEEMA